MNTFRRLLTLLSIALWCTAACPQSASAPTAGTSSPLHQTEHAIAKAELDVTRKFQEQLLATVFWSLGTLAAVAVLLVGYSWWNNSRNYDRDKIAFEREIRTLLAEVAAKLSDEQRTAIQTTLDSLDKKLSERAREAEAKLSSSTTATIEASGKQIAAQVTQIKASLASVRTELDKLHLTAHLQEHLKTRAGGNYRNALQYSVTALEMALKIGDQYEVGNVLDLVSEDVTTILGGKDLPIDNFLIGQLVQVLDSIKGPHAHAAAAIKSLAPRMLSK